MEATARRTWTEDEYLALEAESDQKHEWVNGEIVARAGGSLAHTTLCATWPAALEMASLADAAS